MSSRTPNTSPPSPDDVQDAVEMLIELGFQETAMQFNIGRREGEERRGYDIVNPSTKERWYVTKTGSPKSERAIRDYLGEQGVFGAKTSLSDKEVSIYVIPREAQLLTRVLETSPYGKGYTQQLARRAHNLMQSIAQLDRNLFGLSAYDLALTPSPDAMAGDDVHLTIIPPFEAPSGKPRQQQPLVEFHGADILAGYLSTRSKRGE